MVKLGSWPEDRNYISWMTQRLANRAPEYAHARRWPFSVVQQLLNPTAADIQRVTQQLTEERNNMFLTSASMDLVDRLYKAELGVGMKFNYSQDGDSAVFELPRVYATIDETEHELTIAKRNDIETLCYTSLPSRINDGEDSYTYVEVVPRTQVSNLVSVVPGAMPIQGHLFVTIRENNTWEYRGRQKIYYPKVFIKGITRKGTEVTEAIPVRYNGTFKTVNQWTSVEEVFVSYMDETTEITVEVLPFDRDDTIDTRNLVVPSTGVESWRFLSINSQLWGSTMLSTGFTVNDISTVQLGFDTKDTEYEVELVDESGMNINVLGAAWKPNTDYMFAVDNNKLYVYDTRLPYPDMTMMKTESSNTKMELWSDRWVYTRDTVAYVSTDTLDMANPPWQFRWTLEEPDGTKSYLAEDGTKLGLSVDAWVWNDKWERGEWDERDIPVLLDKNGTYIVTIECLYSDPDQPNKSYVLTTRFMLYAPKIAPEITLDLPTELQGSEGIMFDSDDKLWFKINNDIRSADLFYDYFMVDYARNIVWLKENYTSVRVVL